MTDTTIKFAKEEDIVQISAFGVASFKENLLSELACPVDFNKALINITNYVVDGVTLVKRAEDNPKLLQGVIGMRETSSWWSSSPVLEVYLFFIPEKYRSFKLAKDLINRAKEYAIINRLPIVFDLFAQKDVDKKKKLLKYLGFKECGSHFIFIPS